MHLKFTVPWKILQSMIVVFPAYTHLFILTHLNIFISKHTVKIIPNVRLLSFDYMSASVCFTLTKDHLR